MAYKSMFFVGGVQRMALTLQQLFSAVKNKHSNFQTPWGLNAGLIQNELCTVKLSQLSCSCSLHQ